MTAKHRKTVSAIFASPVCRNISFRNASALLVACGCTISQGNGSRIRLIHERGIHTMHEPHPGKEIKEYQVKYIRDFLVDIGVTP